MQSPVGLRFNPPNYFQNKPADPALLINRSELRKKTKSYNRYIHEIKNKFLTFHLFRMVHDPIRDFLARFNLDRHCQNIFVLSKNRLILSTRLFDHAQKVKI